MCIAGHESNLSLQHGGEVAVIRNTEDMECVLCSVVSKEEQATILYEDHEFLGISPLRAMAPTHVLLFPQAYYCDLPAYLNAEPESVGRLMKTASLLASERGLQSRGFRLAWNFGPDTNQRILHPHLHLLGGARLQDRLA